LNTYVRPRTAAIGSTQLPETLSNSTVQSTPHIYFKGQTGYTIGLYKKGTLYNRSAKQALVSTSSTHAEMRAIFTLVKDLLFLFSISTDLHLPIQLPAIIMEDNSAVIAITTDDQAYLKKCKHFLMVINYIREQVQKIAGEDNMAELHTKPLRDGAFERHAPKILGEKQPATPLKHSDG
jgi:hypothetical protein